MIQFLLYVLVATLVFLLLLNLAKKGKLGVYPYAALNWEKLDGTERQIAKKMMGIESYYDDGGARATVYFILLGCSVLFWISPFIYLFIKFIIWIVKVTNNFLDNNIKESNILKKDKTNEKF